jgi:hypothetical protein
MPLPLLFALLLAAAPADPHASAKASDCDSLDAIPVSFGVDYATEIKPLWSSYGCVGCHNGNNAAGGLDLGGAQVSELCFLLSVPATADATLQRVEPADARNSVLYQKIGCNDPPGFLGRMPPGSPVSAIDQALVYDWIAEGARTPAPPDCETQRSDYVFLDGFESTRP